MTSLNKLLNYKEKEPEYLLLALNYADEYADGLFRKGIFYGVILGAITMFIALQLI